MSTKFNVASDPNGSLAWPLSLLVLLLQRLRFQVGLEQGQIEDWRTSQIADDEELDAVRDLADKFRLLSEADELSLSDIFLGDNVPVRSGLRESFSTLMALENSSFPSSGRLNFSATEKALTKLDLALRSNDLSDLDLDFLTQTQASCSSLLEKIETERPSYSPW